MTLTPAQFGVQNRRLRLFGLKYCRGCRRFKPVADFSFVMKTNQKGGKYPTLFYRCRTCVTASSPRMVEQRRARQALTRV
jgi:hypothetical protein